MNWHEYFINMARAASLKSKDPSTKVGCVIAGPDNQVLTTGYNDLPRGVMNLPERRERPAKYLWTSHAEENAVAQAARSGTRLLGSVAIITHAPCSRCARNLIQAGIVGIVIPHDAGLTSLPQEELDVALQMFHEAGVRFTIYGSDSA